MFFNNPRKELKDFIQFLNKNRKYKCDILKERDLQKLDSIISESRKLLADKKEDRTTIREKLNALQGRAVQLFPPSKNDSWREWTEVILVAAVIAIAFKTYFFQPFKIPTHSMRPTLYGIAVEPQDSEQLPPNPVIGIFHFILQGKTHHRIEVRENGVIREIRETRPLGPLPVRMTSISTGTETYRIWSSYEALLQATNGDVKAGTPIQKGQILANFTVQAGDHLFVSKFMYHFRKPEQGEVFVFTTNGIQGIERRNRAQQIFWGQFYIKRCVGVPETLLRIREPYLYSNGEILDNRPIFQKIYSMKNGYSGYIHGANNAFLSDPEAGVQLHKDQYWAMGDNSPNSWDSRAWGVVPRKNLVGTGFFVYWPFTKRWGLIN